MPSVLKPKVKARLQNPRKDLLPVRSHLPVNMNPDQQDVRGLNLNGAEQKPKSRPKLSKLGGFTNAGQSY